MSVTYLDVFFLALGYGDIVAKTNAERLFAIVVVVFGVLFYSLLTATLSSVIKDLDSANEEKRRKLIQLVAFTRQSNLDEDLQQEVFNFFRVAWKNHNAISPSSLINELPTKMKTPVCWNLFDKIIQECTMFKELPDNAITRIMTEARERVVPKGKMLIMGEEPAEEWMLLSKGIAELVADDNETVILTFLPGSTLGEVSID